MIRVPDDVFAVGMGHCSNVWRSAKVCTDRRRNGEIRMAAGVSCLGPQRFDGKRRCCRTKRSAATALNNCPQNGTWKSEPERIRKTELMEVHFPFSSRTRSEADTSAVQQGGLSVLRHGWLRAASCSVATLRGIILQ